MHRDRVLKGRGARVDSHKPKLTCRHRAVACHRNFERELAL